MDAVLNKINVLGVAAVVSSVFAALSVFLNYKNFTTQAVYERPFISMETPFFIDDKEKNLFHLATSLNNYGKRPAVNVEGAVFRFNIDTEEKEKICEITIGNEIIPGSTRETVWAINDELTIKNMKFYYVITIRYGDPITKKTYDTSNYFTFKYPEFLKRGDRIYLSNSTKEEKAVVNKHFSAELKNISSKKFYEKSRLAEKMENEVVRKSSASENAFDYMEQFVFRVEANWDNERVTASGFSVAILEKQRKLVLATAKHVLDIPKDKIISWKVEQYSDDAKMRRKIEFQTLGRKGEDAHLETHNDNDVGIIVLPAKKSDGSFFIRRDEKLVNLIDDAELEGPGSPVGWAGYSGKVEALSKEPHLAVFNGIVSTLLNKKDKHLYLVDGHIARGVSGGPLWHFSDKRKRYEVIGIASGFGNLDDELPGFCIFEPINHVIFRLKHWRQNSR
ncbi:MAG: hypothetical protein HYU34_02420 [Candidatus Omnitrophica bacterium]|nr:hypothetical protein [Candidatus Omnitrophota bacterium]